MIGQIVDSVAQHFIPSCDKCYRDTGARKADDAGDASDAAASIPLVGDGESSHTNRIISRSLDLSGPVPHNLRLGATLNKRRAISLAGNRPRRRRNASIHARKDYDAHQIDTDADDVEECVENHVPDNRDGAGFVGLPVWWGVVGLAISAVAFTTIVWIFDMGLPWWATITTMCASIVMSYGLGILMGTAAQNMALPSSMLLQLVWGTLLPGNAVANIVAAAVNNAIVAQSLTLLNDYRTAVLLKVRALDMLIMQAFGTAVGCVMYR